jgi:hypothetical protein
MLKATSMEEYFDQSDTPGENSPTGVLMVRVLAKNPGMSFEQARREVYDLLRQAAGRKRYQVPAVLSPQERAESSAGMTGRFRDTRKAA